MDGWGGGGAFSTRRRGGLVGGRVLRGEVGRWAAGGALSRRVVGWACAACEGRWEEGGQEGWAGRLLEEAEGAHAAQGVGRDVHRDAAHLRAPARRNTDYAVNSFRISNTQLAEMSTAMPPTCARRRARTRAQADAQTRARTADTNTLARSLARTGRGVLCMSPGSPTPPHPHPPNPPIPPTRSSSLHAVPISPQRSISGVV